MRRKSLVQMYLAFGDRRLKPWVLDYGAVARETHKRLNKHKLRALLK